MENKRGRPPIIITGMHGSGTTMVARIVEEAGVFLGARKEQNNESIFFLKINDWLLSLAGGAWDHPTPFRLLLQRETILEQIISRLRFLLNTPQLIQFLGFINYLRYRSLDRLDFAWAWKDPRNTFTLPLWLHFFPDAKIIFLYRHGVDVAASLRHREHKIVSRKISRRAKLTYALLTLPSSRKGHDSSPRCFDLEGGFSVWEEYMNQAEKLCTKYPDQILSIRYEDFLLEPYDKFRELSSFLRLKFPEEVLNAIVSRVNVDRMFPYKKRSDFQEYSNSVAPRLAVYGYKP